jgi:fused signal recognition particle receptor
MELDILAGLGPATALLAQQGGVDPMNIAVVVMLLIIVVVAALLVRASRQADVMPEQEPEVDYKRPTKDLLSARIKIEGPVDEKELEGKSLAEVKRIKSAEIESAKSSTKRLTAKAATEQAKREMEELSAKQAAQLEEGKADEGKQEVISASDDEATRAEASGSAATSDAAAELLAEPAEQVAAGPVKPAAAVASAALSKPGETPVSYQAGLTRTREGFGSKIKGFFGGEELSPKLLDELEEFLYTADIGPKAAEDVLEAVRTHLDGKEKRSPAAVWAFVQQHVYHMLKAREPKPLDLESKKPFVMLVVGVNGAGKTTTIGKLANQFRRQGKSVLLVAGDTFRAGAVDQLAVWGERNDIPVHQGKPEQDPASVVYAGIERGVKEQVDVILCDTSGRLHTNTNLMEELKKIERVSAKAMSGAPHETILVLDANMGQNAVQQARTFGSALKLSGIALTKLDGTARGGVILAIAKELDVPVRYVGIGEGIQDLRPFSAEDFVDALFM